MIFLSFFPRNIVPFIQVFWILLAQWRVGLLPPKIVHPLVYPCVYRELQFFLGILYELADTNDQRALRFLNSSSPLPPVTSHIPGRLGHEQSRCPALLRAARRRQHRAEKERRRFGRGARPSPGRSPQLHRGPKRLATRAEENAGRDRL